MVDYVWVDGQRCTPYMAWQIGRLKADFRDIHRCNILVSSALRLEQEQIDIFLARYVTSANVRGRYVYDTRVWNGVRYYRISSAGTVAVPKTSNHEVQGTNGAIDVRDDGPGAGVSVAGSARANWLKANANKYDMEPEGYNFREAWHYKVRSIFNAVPGAPSGGGSHNSGEDDEMLALRIKDKAGTFHLATLTTGVFRHLIGNDNPERVKNIVRADDAWTDISIDELPIYLHTFGCDLNIYRIENGQLVVLDPRNGSVRAGNMWSAVMAYRR